jgi:hypothetical protein
VEIFMQKSFDSFVRSAGDLAGVFEYDDGVGYFYLYEVLGQATGKIIKAIRISSGEPDYAESDIAIRWDRRERSVGLFIRGELWAVFDAEMRHSYGGHYSPHKHADVPHEISAGFEITNWCLLDLKEP